MSTFDVIPANGNLGKSYQLSFDFRDCDDSFRSE